MKPFSEDEMENTRIVREDSRCRRQAWGRTSPGGGRRRAAAEVGAAGLARGLTKGKRGCKEGAPEGSACWQVWFWAPSFAVCKMGTVGFCSQSVKARSY